MNNLNDNNRIRSNKNIGRARNKPIGKNKIVARKRIRKKKRKKIRYNRLIIVIVLIIVMCIIINTSKKNKEFNEIEDESLVSASTEPIENQLEEQENISNETEEKEIKSDNANSEKETKENKENDEEYKVKRTGKAKYYVSVNNKENVVTIYGKDSEGKYTIPVKALICSTGKATPKSGVYKISDKYRWRELKGGVYGQYCSRIVGHILFHSVPYLKSSPDKLEYEEYDKLGTSASAGCVRLTVEDSMWIYNNCEAGTYVEFYSSSNPGPLGKPVSQKITSNTKLRNWDPTDPDPKNPWKN